jgi:GT2 family glycosyltransferase
MYRFWNTIFEPVLKLSGVRSVLEIGSDRGLNTFQLVKYCSEAAGKLYVVDPDLKYDWEALEQEHKNTLTFFHDLSLNVLRDFRSPLDAAFIDGDHNWYSVYNELRLLSAAAEKNGHLFPLIFLHDVEWPYARRDLYYNPDTIPEEFRRKYLKAGIMREQSQLAEDGGLNPHLYHAVEENEPQSGVRTAVEDFLAGNSAPLEFHSIPLLFGLGIIFSPDASYAPALRSFLSALDFNQNQSGLVELVESERLVELTRASEIKQKLKSEQANAHILQETTHKLRLTVRSLEETLAAAEESIATQAADINALRGELESEQLSNRTLRALLLSAQQDIEALRQTFSFKVMRFLARSERLTKAFIQSSWIALRADVGKLFTRRRLRLLRDIFTLKRSEIFDTNFYTQQYPEVATSGMDPVFHYLERGAAEGCNPNAVFDSTWYLRTYSDVASARLNPLLHFIRRGAKEGRFGDSFFDPSFYASQHPDAGHSTMAVMRHFIKHYPHATPSKNGLDTRRIIPSVWPYSYSEAELLERVRHYKQQKANRKARIVVYTAIIGSYDSLILPETIVDDWDYVLYTDAEITGEHIFEVRKPPIDQGSARATARYLKTHPDTLFPEYDYCVWLDASILVRGKHLESAIEQCLSNDTLLVGNPHPHRTCVTEELTACLRLKKDDAQVMEGQVQRYLQEGMPKNFGMLETGILIRKLGDKAVQRFNEVWWQEISGGSFRDQLSVMYAIWKTDLAFEYLPNMKDIRLHAGNDYCLFPHKDRADFQTPLYASPRFLRANEEVEASTNTLGSQMRVIPTHEALPVDIIICVHNALSDVKFCLRSVMRHIQEGQKVIIVDDGSDEQTHAYLREVTNEYSQRTTLLHNPVALGYTRSANIGLKASQAELRILLNSDTIVTPNWGQKLYQVVKENPRVGIVGPLSNAASWQSIPLVSDPNTGKLAINDLPRGVCAEQINAWCEEHLSCLSPAFIPLINGFCYGITANVLNTVGYLDEQAFPRGYGEEDDLSLRAGAAGFLLAAATNTYIFHAKSKSFGSATRAELAKKGAEQLRTRHGEKKIRYAVQTAQSNASLMIARREFARHFGNQEHISTQVSSKQSEYQASTAPLTAAAH